MVALQKYQNKKVAIYGMGITGCSAAKVLKESKAKIFCWDDNKETRCFKCKTFFNMWRRRHHCRGCGRIFCHYCCNDCFSYLFH